MTNSQRVRRALASGDLSVPELMQATSLGREAVKDVLNSGKVYGYIARVDQGIDGRARYALCGDAMFSRDEEVLDQPKQSIVSAKSASRTIVEQALAAMPDFQRAWGEL